MNGRTKRRRHPQPIPAMHKNDGRLAGRRDKRPCEILSCRIWRHSDRARGGRESVATLRRRDGVSARHQPAQCVVAAAVSCDSVFCTIRHQHIRNGSSNSISYLTGNRIIGRLRSINTASTASSVNISFIFSKIIDIAHYPIFLPRTIIPKYFAVPGSSPNLVIDNRQSSITRYRNASCPADTIIDWNYTCSVWPSRSSVKKIIVSSETPYPVLINTKKTCYICVKLP